MVIILARCKFTLYFSIPLYTRLKGRIYHTMQREKLYNLHTTTYSVVVLFVSRVDRIWRANLHHAEKITFLTYGNPNFCDLIVLSRKQVIKREIQHSTRCSVKSSTIFTATLIVIVFKKRKILCDQFLQYSKFGPLRHCLFWKQEVQLRNKLSCVNCRAFRAVAYGMFWSLIQYVNERKINLSHLL